MSCVVCEISWVMIITTLNPCSNETAIKNDLCKQNSNPRLNIYLRVYGVSSGHSKVCTTGAFNDRVRL